MEKTKHIRVQLDYPLQQVTAPIIYELVIRFHLIPNIRRAQIDSHVGGMIVLEIEGESENLEAGQQYLRQLGITVTPVGEGESWTV